MIALTCRCKGRGVKTIPVKRGTRSLRLIDIRGVGYKWTGNKESAFGVWFFWALRQAGRQSGRLCGWMDNVCILISNFFFLTHDTIYSIRMYYE